MNRLKERKDVIEIHISDYEDFGIDDEFISLNLIVTAYAGGEGDYVVVCLTDNTYILFNWRGTEKVSTYDELVSYIGGGY